jgi:Tfp pilus assembly protein PilF
VANGYIPVKAGLETTMAAARKASELDPTLADPYVVVSQVQMAGESDWVGARASVDKALQLDQTSVGALASAAHLTRATGSADDALVLFRKALERDPLNLLTRRYVARVLYHAGRLTEAEATAHQVLDMSPSFSAAHYEFGRIPLARGEVAAAVGEFEA